MFRHAIEATGDMATLTVHLLAIAVGIFDEVMVEYLAVLDAVPPARPPMPLHSTGWPSISQLQMSRL